MSLPPERRRQLQALALRALVKRRYGDDAAADPRTVRFGAGAALITELGDGSALAAVFADDPSGLGAALDTAHREGADRLLFFAELNDGAVARRAAQFRIQTTVVDPKGDMDPIAPAPIAAVIPPPDLAEASARLEAVGLDVLWEHDILLGEYRGLEVARFAPPDYALEVGVGKHDREGNHLLHPEGLGDDALAEARRVVAELRRDGAPPHPANQLVPERWLRWTLIRRPEIADLGPLRPAAPPKRRVNLRERGIAPAVAGDGTVVVCSVGVDPDLVPQAADARLQVGADRPLVIVVPVGDDHEMTRRLAALLAAPAEVRTVPAGWRALVG